MKYVSHYIAFRASKSEFILLNGIDAAKSAEDDILRRPATIPPLTFPEIVNDFLAVNLKFDPRILISGESIKTFLEYSDRENKH